MYFIVQLFKHSLPNIISNLSQMIQNELYPNMDVR